MKNPKFNKICDTEKKRRAEEKELTGMLRELSLEDIENILDEVNNFHLRSAVDILTPITIDVDSTFKKKNSKRNTIEVYKNESLINTFYSTEDVAKFLLNETGIRVLMGTMRDRVFKALKNNSELYGYTFKKIVKK